MTKLISYKKILIFAALIASFLAQNILAQKNSLKTEIKQIIQPAKGDVGVSVIGLEDNFSFNINADERFPMQSVYKFPLALAVLNQVDKGKLSLDQKIHVTKGFASRYLESAARRLSRRR